jgi:hypothetical protein
MRREPERGQDADLVAGCLARDHEALARLAEMFVATLCAPVEHRLCHRLGCDEGMIEDAEQEVWCRLLTTPAGVLAKFHPARASLAAYLIALVCRQARALSRAEQRHHDHERAALAAEIAERGAEADWAGLAQWACVCLTPRERAFMLDLQQGKLPEEFRSLSGAARWQLTCRIRRKVRQCAATADGGRGGEKSDFPVRKCRPAGPITVDGPTTT